MKVDKLKMHDDWIDREESADDIKAFVLKLCLVIPVIW